ncbi:MAG: hypothetical protein K2Q18_09595 [Bdellovibrionales bacterium]|nr:hypothetical protein [Bdellovibrionales bacterium]
MNQRFYSTILFSFLLVVSACSSISGLQKKPVCAVWKDQKYMGPYSIEVVEKQVRWSGQCQGSHWKCKEVSVSYDEANNVLMNFTTNIGVISGTIFTGSSKYISIASAMVLPDKKEVQAGGSIFQYNDKCSNQDAIVGTVALGLIAEAQGK